MIITHASSEKIEKITVKHNFCDFYHGCLFFAQEGNAYNMANNVEYQYDLDVKKVFDVSRLQYEFNCEENETILEVVNELRNLLNLELSNEEMLDILDGSVDNVGEYTDDYQDDWHVQQYQGILAHRLGYDCAESSDEQGTVYIAYCVGREKDLVEHLCN